MGRDRGELLRDTDALLARMNVLVSQQRVKDAVDRLFSGRGGPGYECVAARCPCEDDDNIGGITENPVWAEWCGRHHSGTHTYEYVALRFPIAFGGSDSEFCNDTYNNREVIRWHEDNGIPLPNTGLALQERMHDGHW